MCPSEVPAPEHRKKISTLRSVTARASRWCLALLKGKSQNLSRYSVGSHQPVLSRYAIDRRLRIERAITWSWFATALIPVVYLIWNHIQPAPHAHRWPNDLDKRVVFPALAGVCSGVGAIVAIFLPLTLHQFTASNSLVHEPPEVQFRRQWLTRLQRVTKLNVFMAIFVLLADTILVLLSIGGFEPLLSGIPTDINRAYSALSLLIFGLTCFALQLFTLGVTESGDLDRIGRGGLLEEVPWNFYVKSILLVLTIESLLSFLLGLTVIAFLDSNYRDQARVTIYYFCLIIWLPILLATFYTLLTSKKYRDLWRDRFLRKWGERAGLGLVCNFDITDFSHNNADLGSMKVLLNRQEREPFRGMWLLPGGYINPKKGDSDLHDTVCRRLQVLTGIEQRKFFATAQDKLASPVKKPQKRIRQQFKNIAQWPKSRIWPQWALAKLRSRLSIKLEQWSILEAEDFSLEYSQMVLRYGHAPTDTVVYRVMYRVNDSETRIFREEDIDTSENSELKWQPLAKIEDDIEIPEHLRKLLLLLISSQPFNGLWWRER